MIPSASTLHHDTEYHDLPQEEPPRDRFPFPAIGDPCPKCGRLPGSGIVHRANFFRCHTCGTVLERVIVVVPLRPGMKGKKVRRRVAMVEAVCSNPKCGKTFEKRVSNPSTLCTSCRNKAAAKAWREAHPEGWRRIQRKHDRKRTRAKVAAGIEG